MLQDGNARKNLEHKGLKISFCYFCCREDWLSVIHKGFTLIGIYTWNENSRS